MLSLKMGSLHAKAAGDGKVFNVFTSYLISEAVIKTRLLWTGKVLWHEALWSQSV